MQMRPEAGAIESEKTISTANQKCVDAPVAGASGIGVMKKRLVA